MADPSVDAWVLTVPEALEDDASGLAWNAGCAGITIEKAEGDRIRLVCFFADASAHEEEMRALAAGFGTTATRVSVPNPDWVKHFKETFVAFDVPPFRVVPEWVDESAASLGDRGTIRIRIDPGRAFGTGTHESTKLCLTTFGRIADTLSAQTRVLDLGCGTGILAIAAAKRLGARVVACDYDPLATASTEMHAAMNGVSLEVLLMDGCRGLEPGRFDLVFANLMAPFLISRVDEITAMGAPGSRFILAGLLRVEEEEVKAAWPRDWRVTATYQNEWASLLYERP